MFICIEGENKTGKSSLARLFQKLTGWEIIKFSQPKKEPYIEYMEFLLERKEPAILDRFYLGEKVYGPLWRGKSELNEWQTRMIEMAMMARFTLNIYSETNEKTIIENFKKEKEELAKVEQIPAILNLFRQAVKNSRLVWNHFDYSADKDYKKIIKIFVPWLSKYKVHENYLKTLQETRAIGNPFAKNLIVGDVCNGDLELKKYSHIIMPFAKGTSSDYLWKAIDKIDKNKYLMTNVRKYHKDKKLDFTDIFSTYAHNIVCLGSNSYNELTSEQNKMLPLFKSHKITKVKHPAWGSRFMIDPALYALGIKQSLI